MRRRRSYRHRSPQRSYTWQSVHVVNPIGPTIAADAVDKGVMVVTKPGVGMPGSERAFDAPHVLERMRGDCFHEANTTSLNPAVLAVQMAALRIPSEFANTMEDETDQASIIDITNNLSGDDYLWYHSSFCGDKAEAPTVIPVDNKARRKFDVGDVLAFLYRVSNPTSADATFNLGLNFRLLWKLGK